MASLHSLDFSNISLLIAISRERGMIGWRCCKTEFRADYFFNFIIGLYQETSGWKKQTFVMDNAKINRARKIREAYVNIK